MHLVNNTLAHLAYDCDLTEVASTTALNQDHTSSQTQTVDMVTSSCIQERDIHQNLGHIRL